jgi:hypothetical protein
MQRSFSLEGGDRHDRGGTPGSRVEWGPGGCDSSGRPRNPGAPAVRARLLAPRGTRCRPAQRTGAAGGMTRSARASCRGPGPRPPARCGTWRSDSTSLAEARERHGSHCTRACPCGPGRPAARGSSDTHASAPGARGSGGTGRTHRHGASQPVAGGSGGRRGRWQRRRGAGDTHYSDGAPRERQRQPDAFRLRGTRCSSSSRSLDRAQHDSSRMPPRASTGSMPISSPAPRDSWRSPWCPRGRGAARGRSCSLRGRAPQRGGGSCRKRCLAKWPRAEHDS